MGTMEVSVAMRKYTLERNTLEYVGYMLYRLMNE